MKKFFYFAIVIIAFTMSVTSCHKSVNTDITSTDSTYVDTVLVDSVQSVDSIL